MLPRRCAMHRNVSAASRLARFVLIVILSAVPAVFAQENRYDQDRDQDQRSVSRTPDTTIPANIRSVAQGQKTKLKGSIVRREADTFTVRDDQNLETTVVLTDRTSV